MIGLEALKGLLHLQCTCSEIGKIRKFCIAAVSTFLWLEELEK